MSSGLFDLHARVVELEAYPAPPRRERIGATTDSIGLVANNGGTGCLLVFDGRGIEAEVDEIGSKALDDIGLDDAPDGLTIWEGRLHVSSPDYFTGEVDCMLEGTFRDLSDREWTLLRETGVPWELKQSAP